MKTKEILEDLVKKSAHMGMLQTQGKISFNESVVFAQGHVDYAMQQLKIVDKSQDINWDEVSDDKINESASKEGFSGEYRFGYAKGMKAMREKIKSLINP